MRLKHSIGVVAVLLACQAGATVIDWADHGPLEIAVGVTPSGTFTDTVNFTLDSATSLWATTVSNNLGPFLGITDGKISLYEHGPSGPDVLLGSYDFSGTTGDSARSFTTNGPGSFYYSITGKGTGSGGGIYTLSSAPVPEPRTMTLALCGLVALAVASRRRSRSQP